jgi:hypothetical protein
LLILLTETLPDHCSSRDDWLVLAGGIGKTDGHLATAVDFLAGRFARLIRASGNHELWTTSRYASAARGVARYEALVELLVAPASSPLPLAGTQPAALHRADVRAAPASRRKVAPCELGPANTNRSAWCH